MLGARQPTSGEQTTAYIKSLTGDDVRKLYYGTSITFFVIALAALATGNLSLAEFGKTLAMIAILPIMIICMVVVFVYVLIGTMFEHNGKDMPWINEPPTVQKYPGLEYGQGRPTQDNDESGRAGQ